MNLSDSNALKELNNQEETAVASILKQVFTEDLENLINLRERSIQLKLKRLNEIAFGLLKETFAFKNSQVKRIRWNESEPILMEFLMKNDRVRPVKELSELKGRLDGSGFGCYGVFHDRLNLPVSFVFIRFYRGLPDNLPDLFAKDFDQLDSCIFYSISSPVKGLNGIEFGANLIKSVTREIKQENPQIKLFATFSPIPMFRPWLQKQNETDLAHLSLPAVHSQKSALLEICAKYLEKGKTIDPVARFHYRNGARLGPIHFAADMSEESFKQSYGIQVNYIYYQ